MVLTNLLTFPHYWVSRHTCIWCHFFRIWGEQRFLPIRGDHHYYFFRTCGAQLLCFGERRFFRLGESRFFHLWWTRSNLFRSKRGTSHFGQLLFGGLRYSIHHSLSPQLSISTSSSTATLLHHQICHQTAAQRLSLTPGCMSHHSHFLACTRRKRSKVKYENKSSTVFVLFCSKRLRSHCNRAGVVRNIQKPAVNRKRTRTLRTVRADNEGDGKTLLRIPDFTRNRDV